MGVKIEMKELERMLTSDLALKSARAAVVEMVAKGLNQAKELATRTKPELAQSIRAGQLTEDASGVVQGEFGTNLDYAPYVEFGTGRPGTMGEVKNGEQRNPAADSFTYTLQTVIQSGKHAGSLRDGWVYKDPKTGLFVHTLGQAANPFMYPAQAMLENKAAEIAGMAVRDSIRKA